MKTIRHPNIVLFLGAGLHEFQPFLVVEFMSRGPLSSLLRNQSIPVDKDQQIRWALDIAKGIRYLHGLTPPRIHRDLKTSNILLSERWAAKVRAPWYPVMQGWCSWNKYLVVSSYLFSPVLASSM